MRPLTQTVYLLVISLLIIGCRDDADAPGLIQEALPGEALYNSTLSFQLTSITQRAISKPKQQESAFLGQIAAEPIRTQQRVSIRERLDGEIDMTVLELSPTYSSNGIYDHSPAVDDIPDIVRTEVAGGVASYLDRNNNLLHQHLFEGDQLASREWKRFLGTYDWNTYITSNNTVVERLNGSTVLIRRQVSDDIAPRSEPSLKSSGWYTEEVVVEDLNLLLGSSLHRSDGSYVHRTVYKYQYLEHEERWLPHMQYYEEYVDNHRRLSYEWRPNCKLASKWPVRCIYG